MINYVKESEQTPENLNDLIALLKASGLTPKLGPWQDVTFQNSWVNFGSDFNSAQYAIDTLGFCHLRGVVKDGTVETDPIFTLPIGFRPENRCLFSTISNHLLGRIDVYANGEVIARNPSSNIWVSLDDIYFKVA